MIDAHQACGVYFLLVAKIALGNVGRWIFTRRTPGWGRYCAQCIIGPHEEAIERRPIAMLHAWDYSNAARSNGILRAPQIWSPEMYLRSVCLIGLLVLATPLFAAEEEAAEEKSPWSGNVKLGYLATSGNTESSSLNSGFRITYEIDLWKHEATAAAIQSTESNVTTAEAFDFGWLSARNISDHDFIFGRLDWRKDRFASIEQQFSQSVGYGRRLIDKEAHKLNGELGIGARQSDLDDGTDESDTILTGRLTYKWQISETASFGQVFLVESGSSNTFSESVTNLSARLVGRLALVVSYTVRHNSDVLPGTENTDTRTALSLEYGF
jgi:putative salt-induced outer membrane protein